MWLACVGCFSLGDVLGSVLVSCVCICRPTGCLCVAKGSTHCVIMCMMLLCVYGCTLFVPHLVTTSGCGLTLMQHLPLTALSSHQLSRVFSSVLTSLDSYLLRHL